MTRQLIFAAIAVLCCIGAVAGFRCYQCSGTACNVPNPATDDKECGAQESVCFKTYGGVGAAASTTRGCGKATITGAEKIGANECLNLDIQGVSTAICNCNSKMLCNAAGRSHVSFLTAGISVISAIVLAKLI